MTNEKQSEATYTPGCLSMWCPMRDNTQDLIAENEMLAEALEELRRAAKLMLVSPNEGSNLWVDYNRVVDVCDKALAKRKGAE